MFGRSQSGPGGLSINTSAANTLSNNSSQPPPSSVGKLAPSLFGSIGTSQPQQQTSSLFGNVSQPQQGGGLFGSSTQTATNQPQQQGSSLFGNVQFGSQQNQQQMGGGLFGSSNMAQQQTQPQHTGGLFASTGQNQNQPQQQSSLFGGLGYQNKTNSLFGSNQNTQNQQNNLQKPPPASIFSHSIGQQNQQQTIPGVKISVNELRGTTRFNDLHEELQKAIEYVDTFILSQIKQQEDIAAVSEKLNNTAHQMGPDVDYCAKSLETMQNALEYDAHSIAHAKELVKADAGDANLSFKVIQNLKQPAQFHQSGSYITPPIALRPSLTDDKVGAGATRTLVDYFSNQSEDMGRSLDAYKLNIQQVENYLKGVESNTTQQIQQLMLSRSPDGGDRSAEDQVRELAAVLRDFETGIMGVATKVGGAREQVQEVMLSPFETTGTRIKRLGRY